MKTECEGCDNIECQDCCEHDEIDNDAYCRDCGKDMMSKSYDYFKDLRKYE
jgi:hypothetical protein